MSALVLYPDGVYVDATFGRGGHSRAILERLSMAGRLIGLDRDPDAIEAGRALAHSDRRFSIVQGSFATLTERLAEADVQGRQVSGILLDLGVSSPQLDQAERGFSFAADGPLDMRMDPSSGMSAAQWLMRADQSEIATVLRELGEERHARRIARVIVETRLQTPIVTTSQLAALVSRTIGRHEPGKHPATRTFQALRIQINDELGALRACLAQVCDLLETTGRLVVISFHSLEDRIVKRFIRTESQGPMLPKGLPVPATDAQGRLRALGKPLRACADEVSINPRSRSAIMRVAERLS